MTKINLSRKAAIVEEVVFSCGRTSSDAMSHVLEQEGSICTSTVDKLDDLNCGRTSLQSRQLSRKSSHGGKTFCPFILFLEDSIEDNQLVVSQVQAAVGAGSRQVYKMASSLE
ncbi:uncharacterized protein LOC144213782 [Stigmatopora nigra]